jgi:hypothetical protein
MAIAVFLGFSTRERVFIDSSLLPRLLAGKHLNVERKEWLQGTTN